MIERTHQLHPLFNITYAKVDKLRRLFEITGGKPFSPSKLTSEELKAVGYLTKNALDGALADAHGTVRVVEGERKAELLAEMCESVHWKRTVLYEWTARFVAWAENPRTLVSSQEQAQFTQACAHMRDVTTRFLEELSTCGVRVADLAPLVTAGKEFVRVLDAKTKASS